MKIESLWYEAKPRGRSNLVDVTLRRCPNCGEVKVFSRPCGFDHLAAVMEFQTAADHPARPGGGQGEGTRGAE